MSKKQTSADTDNNFESLINEIRNSLETHLREMLSRMFIDADEKLFELANSATSNKDQNRYFELMRNLRAQQQEISANFITNTNLLLLPFAETEGANKESTADNEEELSLIGPDEMDNIVRIKSISSDVAQKYQEALSHLETRLEHLAQKTPDIFSKKALDPFKICQAFDDALENNFDITNKKHLFDLFNSNVACKLNTIYDAINKLLINADILPQIKLHTSKSAVRKYPTPPRQHTGTEDFEDEQFINQGGYAMTATPGHHHRSNRNSGSHGNHVGQPDGVEQQDSYATSASSPVSSGDGASTSSSAEIGEKPVSGNYQHNTAGMPANQVSQTLENYLGSPIEPGSESQNENSKSYPVATQQYYGHDDILAALSGLQIKPEFSSSGELKFDGEAIKRAVLAEISKTSGGVVTKRINHIAEKTIDFIELIFDAIIEDEDISDTIKALLLRLQIPVIKASMVDQEFFIYDDHPARVLLDRIAEVGIGVTEHADEIYIELDKIISRLVSEFELQTSSFQQALDTLNAFVDERDEIARQQEEETQRQVLRGHARNVVLKSLRSITRGKILPESTHALVLKRWPTIMYNHYLNHGKENDDWVTIVVTLRDIIESIQPLKTAQDLSTLNNSKDELIETALEHLNRTNQSKQDIKTVIKGLEDVYQLNIDNAHFDEEAEDVHDGEDDSDTQDEQTPEQKNLDETPELEPIEDEEPPATPLPANVMPGMWFQIYMGEGTALRRGKLSVIIAQDSNLVFVNYQGGIIIEKSFEEFSDELEQNLSKPIMGHSVFDHALSRVVTNLNK